MVRIPTTRGQRQQAKPPEPEAPKAVVVEAPAELPDLEIVCPLTGEIIPPDDIDHMIEAYERCKQASDQLYAVQVKLRHALANLTEGDAKTRRIQGRRRRAVIEMPGDSWDQSILKEAWNSFPDLRDQALKIDQIGVKLREYRKLVNTSGAADLTTFRDMVTRANRGQTGTPTVKVEQ